MKNFRVIFSLIFVCGIKEVFSQGISDQCLGCICEASTGCDLNQGCSDAGVCGPFLISRPFWIDAGKVHLTGRDASDPKAYEECTRDVYCASETIRGYTEKYAKDCNGDGKVDCEDFIRIHKLGPNSCESSSILETKFYQKFSACKAKVNPQ